MPESSALAPISGHHGGFFSRASIALAMLLLTASAFAQSGPPPGGGPGGFGNDGPGGMRPPRRPPEIKPLKREDFDKTVTAMFRKVDANSDGVLTLAELQTEIDARRGRVIAARFRHVDTNGNGSIELSEFTAWQRQMGSIALSDDQTSRIDEALIPAVIGPDLGDKEQDSILRDLIEPLNATMLVQANADYDAGVTLAELLAHEGARFQTADSDRDGRISPDEARSLKPQKRPRPEGMPSAFPVPPPG